MVFILLQFTTLDMTEGQILSYHSGFCKFICSHFKIVMVQNCSPCLWVPVTAAWRVLRLRMEEWPPIWRVAANKLNKQSRAADRGWSSSLGLGEALTTTPCEKHNVMEYS